jgi:hypothetical protein
MTTYTVQVSSLGQVFIIRSDGANIPKDPANSDYRQYLEDVTQSVADQSELDAIAKAEADAKAQVDADAKAQAAFDKQLAATNAKLMALGLTAQDIGTLLSAAKG